MPLGCGSGLGQVTVRQDASDSRPALPDITITRLQKCVTQYGGLLEPRAYRLNPTVKVDPQGLKRGVTLDDVPTRGYDFAACTRIVLNEMAIPDGILPLPSTPAKAPTNDTTTAQRSYMGSPVVVVVVIVGLAEIALEAGAYTFLFAVTVKVLDKAKDDVVDAAKRWRPRPNKIVAWMLLRVASISGKSFVDR